MDVVFAPVDPFVAVSSELLQAHFLTRNLNSERLAFLEMDTHRPQRDRNLHHGSGPNLVFPVVRMEREILMD